MATFVGDLIGRTVDRLVRGVVIPVAAIIVVLVEHGVLLAAFAALWVAGGAALVADPTALDRAWVAIGQLPLPIQGLAWLLFLPLMAGLWVWSTDWAPAVRLVLVAAIAGWNLLVFIPRPSVRRQPAGS